jgi:signal recognition particle receptor subunit beta
VVVVSYSGKEINAKLVYYGAGLSGKTTNLESIYEAVPDSSRGKMVSMKTQSDRTLFFDLLPLDLGEIMGFKTRFLLYTVPGQVFYNATRKLVLKGADAIVFVADSEVGKMDENKESLANLRANLEEYDLKLDEIPWVIQYNKRDLPNVYTIEELNRDLNPDGKIPVFEAVATAGKGVFETFRGISHLLMEKVTRELRRTPVSGRGAKSADDGARAGAARPTDAASAAMPSMLGSAFPGMSPTPGVTPRPAAAEPAAPAAPEPLVVSGPPSMSASTPRETDSGFGFEYGRELSLGGDEPATPPAPRVIETAPLELTAEPLSTGGPVAFTPDPKVRPVTVAQETRSQATGDARGSVRESLETFGSTPTRPSVATADLALEREHRVVAVPTATSADAAPTGAGSTEVVVPLAIPKGATREIVLRIVITTEGA